MKSNIFIHLNLRKLHYSSISTYKVSYTPHTQGVQTTQLWQTPN